MWICGQPVLYSNIQARQGYIVRFYLRKLNKQTNKRRKSNHVLGELLLQQGFQLLTLGDLQHCEGSGPIVLVIEWKREVGKTCDHQAEENSHLQELRESPGTEGQAHGAYRNQGMQQTGALGLAELEHQASLTEFNILIELNHY